jgi:hypothetical protein
MPHSTEFFGTVGSLKKILSGFPEAVKVTVYKKISQR